MMMITFVTTTALTAARYRCNMEFPRLLNSHPVGFVPLRLLVDAPFLPKVVTRPDELSLEAESPSHSSAFEQVSSKTANGRASRSVQSKPLLV